MLSLCQMLIFISWEGYQHFPMHWVIITTAITKKVCYGNASNIKAVRTSNLYTKADYFSFFFLLKKLLQRLEAIRPTRSLSRDSLLKDHFKQKQNSKRASRSRPSSAKSTTVSPIFHVLPVSQVWWLEIRWVLQVPGYQVAHVNLHRGEKFLDLFGNPGGSFVVI